MEELKSALLVRGRGGGSDQVCRSPSGPHPHFTSTPHTPLNQVSHTNSAAIKTDMYKAALETLGEVST